MSQLSNDLVPWDVRMCFDLALGVEDIQTLLGRYSVPAQTYEQWARHPTFQRTISEFAKHIRENGLSFRAKARIQAEDLLGGSYQLIYNPDTPASVRADLIKWTAKMAELEPQQAQANEEKITNNMMKDMLERMTDGDLEVRVMQVLSKKRDLPIKDVE